jgi:hypothetical protein
MFEILIRRVSHAVVCAGLAFAALHAYAQGGPPMLTDDPGTPGDGHWEINIATLSDHSGDTSTYALPLLDLNYGVGDRLQLKFEMPWIVEHVDGHGHQSGAGNSLAGVKWRFFDAGEDAWQMSMYPQVRTRFPVSGSPLADGGVAWLLPFEVQRKFGDWGVNFDVGRWLRPAGEGDSWIGGVAIGRELSKNLEVIGELHEEFRCALATVGTVHAARFRGQRPAQQPGGGVLAADLPRLAGQSLAFSLGFEPACGGLDASRP